MLVWWCHFQEKFNIYYSIFMSSKKTHGAQKVRAKAQPNNFQSESIPVALSP